MSDFRKLSDTVFASPQITPDIIGEAKELGITTIINNRPDDEEAGQPAGGEIEAAAQAAGMDYVAIPVTSAGFSEPQVEAMTEALAGPQGKVLAFCRSGTRSTLLWSLAQAAAGKDPDAITAAARGAGYDVSPIRPAMDMFAARSKG
ncbi:TIGR01244 family sulfur transferase [Erythrobacter sp. W53]|uniref:TIGR01244 family sulfur transferase n=1 Tax=Erythrobacter sp. W53 TaxID=3425947 RepID=UPI003D766EE5